MGLWVVFAMNAQHLIASNNTHYYKYWVFNLKFTLAILWSHMSDYSSQGIQWWEEKPLKKFLNIWLIIYQLHLVTQKTMEDCDMMFFLCGVLQVYLEFWNSSCPFEEYVPDFMKPSRYVQDECAHDKWSQTHQKLPISTQHKHGLVLKSLNKVDLRN